MRNLRKEYIIKLLNEPKSQSIEINSNNIKSLKISDDWKCHRSLKTNEIRINLDGYIEIETFRKVNYDEINMYVYELMIFIQLLKPDKLEINKIKVFIDGTYFGQVS